jgi:hypothetical protein
MPRKCGPVEIVAVVPRSEVLSAVVSSNPVRRSVMRTPEAIAAGYQARQGAADLHQPSPARSSGCGAESCTLRSGRDQTPEWAFPNYRRGPGGPCRMRSAESAEHAARCGTGSYLPTLQRLPVSRSASRKEYGSRAASRHLAPFAPVREGPAEVCGSCEGRVSCDER